ncbi:MAG: hypothetical protein ABIJ09_14400 [Pseudomonadota bacterium]
MVQIRQVSVLLAMTAVLLGVAPRRGEIKPHLFGRIAYQGELTESPGDIDKVALFKQLPPGVSVLGEARIVVADQLEPSVESAERVLKEVTSRLGGDAVAVVSSKDVTSTFRKPQGDLKRGTEALEEFEMAAVVARTHEGGGVLLIGPHELNVTGADRFGDADVTGPVTLTLSRTHDMREWSIGRVGPRYRAERQDRVLTVVTGPSGVEYDVRIVGKRAKVYRHGTRTEITRTSGNPNNVVAVREVELYYQEFVLKIGSFALAAHRGP